jgi:predicted ATPase/DNA-binding CsgD family transcriptional regulator
VPDGPPTFLTSFLGREADIAEVSERLRTVRLLTLAGSGGVGKTRLAAVVAADLAAEFVDGAWFVELAPIADPELVPTTAARALGVLETHGRSALDGLITALRSRQALLVLDNCEHLVEACAQLADALLGPCRQLTILATSREPLGLASETVWRVPSLSSPSAVRLFVERAQSVLPAFEHNASNASAVASICQQLDGIPLAIELAAARASALTPDQIAARLGDRFRLLTAGSRTAPTRQLTLRATIDWSYQLLDESERSLLCSLAVFAGGWSLEAAEAVCGSEVPVLLAQLIDKSLVQADLGAGGGRYHLLETVRQYARERLAELGQSEALRQRHAAFFVDLAEQAAPALSGRDQVRWLRRLDPEHENIHTALVWTRDHHPFDGLRLALGVWPHWLLRGHLREGRAWLEQLMSSAPEHSVARADALRAAGELATRQGDVAGARAHLERSLALFQTLGDRRGEGLVLERFGLTFALDGEFERGRVLMEAGLNCSREVGDRRAIGWTLGTLGMLALTAGDPARGQVCLEESLALLRQMSDQHGIGYALGILGQADRMDGQYARARTRLEEALALLRAVGDRPFVGWVLADLGDVLRLSGDLAGSRALLSEALGVLRDVGSSRHLSTTLVTSAVLEIKSARHARGVALSVAAQANYGALRSCFMPDELAEWDAALIEARRVLRDVEFAQAWTEGEALSLEQAITYALTGPAPAAKPVRESRDALALLSPREREVALLVARGLSNKEVAEQLVVAERTAEAHVSHVLTKLGLRSRSQMAAYLHAGNLQVPRA